MAALIPKNGSPLPPSSIEDILEAMTRTPTQILGEPPLSPLPKRPVQPPCISYEAALAITRSYVDPITLLGESPLPKHLPPKKPRKRARLHSDDELPNTPPKRRKKGANIPSITITVPKKSEAGVSLSVGEKPSVDPIKQGKSLKLTVRLPKKTPTALGPVSPSKKEEGVAGCSKPESATKPSAKEPSAKEPSKQSRRRKEKSRPRSSPIPASEAVSVQTARRSSPAPESDSQHARKRKDRPALRSSPAPLADTNDVKKVIDKSRSSAAVVSDKKGDRKDAERPMFKSSTVPFSEPKDSRKSSDRSKPKCSAAEYSDSKESDGRKSKPSPAARADTKESKRKGDRQKSHKSALRESESKDGASRSVKKPPSSVPLSRPVVRIPRSEPAAPRSTSPEAPRKDKSAKATKGNRGSCGKKETTVSRKSSEKERRNEQSISRRRESSVERSRRNVTKLSRRRRESSVEVVPSCSKLRDTRKLRSKVDDDGFCDRDEAISRLAEKKVGADGENDYALLPVHEGELSKRKGKERRQLRDAHKSVVREKDIEKQTMKETTARKPMFRSVPASAIVESGVGEAKSSEVAGAVFRSTKGSASPG
ncbi:unnamed protein product, partial [Agarophyton chilense]